MILEGVFFGLWKIVSNLIKKVVVVPELGSDRHPIRQAAESEKIRWCGASDFEWCFLHSGTEVRTRMYFMLGRGIAVSSINILKFVSAVNQPESRLHGHAHIRPPGRNKWIKNKEERNTTKKLKTPPHRVPQTVRSHQALRSATALAESRIAREERFFLSPYRLNHLKGSISAPL